MRRRFLSVLRKVKTIITFQNECLDYRKQMFLSCLLSALTYFLCQSLIPASLISPLPRSVYNHSSKVCVYEMTLLYLIYLPPLVLDGSVSCRRMARNWRELPLSAAFSFFALSALAPVALINLKKKTRQELDRSNQTAGQKPIWWSDDDCAANGHTMTKVKFHMVTCNTSYYKCTICSDCICSQKLNYVNDFSLSNWLFLIIY